MTTVSSATTLRGPARAILVISTINWMAMALYTLGALAANSTIYLAVHGHPPARHALDAHSSDAVGLNPIPIPWEIFAAGGLVMVAVAVLTLNPKRRVVTGSFRRIWLLQTSPGVLAGLAFFGAGVMVTSIGSYSGLLTVFDPYYLGPILALAAGFISLLCWQRDSPAVKTRTPATGAQPLARVLGAILLADFLVVMVVGFGGLVLNQALYLSSNGGALPPDVHRYSAGTDIWVGYLPIALPSWFFIACSSLLLALTLATWPRANQFGPDRATRVFFRRTTAPALLAFGLLFFLAEATVNLFYGSGAASEPAFRGPAIALVAVIVAIVRWAMTPLLLRSQARKRRAQSKRRRKTVSSHG